MRETDSPFISVVVPVHNNAATLGQVLDSLCNRQQQVSDLYEVLVVDDGSKDKSLETANRYPCRVIRAEDCGGAARARNIGASSAKGKVLCFIDADVVPLPNTLSLIESFLKEHPDVPGIVGRYTITQPHNGFFTKYKNAYTCYDYERDTDRSHVFAGALFAVRREHFDGVGGFTPGLFVEDAELSSRLAEEGIILHHEPELRGTHLKNFTFGSLFRTNCKRILGLAGNWGRQSAKTNKNYSSSIRLDVRLSFFSAFFFALSLLAAVFEPRMIIVAGVWLGIFAVVSAGFIGFLRQHFGLGFAISAFLFYLFEMCYASLLTSFGLVYEALKRLRGAT